MLTVATLLWDPNDESESFSRIYSEEWVERLYRGFARNLSRPFEFVCFTDRPRQFAEPIEQRKICGVPGYASCIQPYRLDAPMILVGLDTVVVGNCDALADYCLYADTVALPRDPYALHQACNGVALVPAGKRAEIFDPHRGENDMEWLRTKPHAFLDDLYPGAVVSFKGTAKRAGLRPETAIVYFHGLEKPHELSGVGWVARHWR